MSKKAKSRRAKVNIPEWFSEHLKNINDMTILGMLYKLLILRESSSPYLLYTCHSCGHIYTSSKLHEEYINCISCQSSKITSTVKSTVPKYQDISQTSARELIRLSTERVNSLKMTYYSQISCTECKEVGFCKNGFYFQFTGTGGPKAEAPTFIMAIMKASIMYPFLWDFDFDWNKFNVKNIKIHQVLPILS